MLYFKSLETEQLTNAVALSEITPAILTLFGMFVLQEVGNPMEVIDIILIFAGAFLRHKHRGLKINRKLVPCAARPNLLDHILAAYNRSVVDSNTFVFQMLASRITQIIPCC